MNFSSKQLRKTLARISKWKQLIRLTVAICVLVFAHFVGIFASRALSLEKKPFNEEKEHKSIAYSIIGTIVYWTIILIVLVLIPSFVGIDTTFMVAYIGAIVITIGIGLQGTVADLASGVMLLVSNPFRLYDYIEVPAIDVIGTVYSFGILYTKIVDEDTGVSVIVPNRNLSENAIINHTSAVIHAVVIEVVVSNNTMNMKEILETLRQRVQQFPGVLDEPSHKVTCNVSDVSALGTTIEVRVGLTPYDFEVNGTSNKRSELKTFIREVLVEMGVELVSRTSR